MMGYFIGQSRISSATPLGILLCEGVREVVLIPIPIINIALLIKLALYCHLLEEADLKQV